MPKRANPESPALRCSVPTFHQEALTLLGLIESDFGQSGREIRLESIRVELESAYELGRSDQRDAQNAGGEGREV